MNLVATSVDDETPVAADHEPQRLVQCGIPPDQDAWADFHPAAVHKPIIAQTDQRDLTAATSLVSDSFASPKSSMVRAS